MLDRPHPRLDGIVVEALAPSEPAYWASALSEAPLTAAEIASVLRMAGPVVLEVHGGDQTLTTIVGRSARMSDVDRVAREPPRPAEPLPQWWARMFDAPATLVLDQVERFAGARIASLLAPVFEHSGLPSGGIRTQLVLGDDGSDGLGARILEGPTLLLPLSGPPRTVSHWSPEAFTSVAKGRPLSFELEALELLAHGQRVAPGDALLLPAGHALLEGGSELRASLRVTWGNVTTREFLKEAVLAEAARTLDDLSQTVDFDELDPDGDRLVQQVLGDGRALAGLSRSEWIRRALECRRLELHTNAGFVAAPRLRSTEGLVLAGRRIRRVQPFPIEGMVIGDRLAVFVRGRSFSTASKPGIHALIEQLRADDALEVDALVEAADLSSRGVLRLLTVLWSYGGIEEGEDAP